MTEEQVTKALLRHLMNDNWHIICFDFPQSGTGKVLHPDDSNKEKNKHSIIPDIVAVRNNIAVFFENKDRFYFPDYQKINELIVNNQYSKAITELLSDYNINKIYYGIGLPLEKHTEKSQKAAYLVNFILGVNPDKQITILHNPESILF